MQVKLSSGKYSIVASGEVYLFGPNEDLVIQVDDGDAFQVKIVMKFTENSSGERDINTEIENDSLVINCVNFNRSGTGLRCPAHIAEVNGKKVYFIFSTSYLGAEEDKARSVKYTVFWER